MDKQGSYEGRFVENRFEALGKMELRGGKGTYIGAFKNGMRHGLGLAQIEDLRHFGYFELDEIEGLGEQETAEGSKVTGWFVRGLLDGFGVVILKLDDGSQLIERGYYQEGLKEGWIRETCTSPT